MGDSMVILWPEFCGSRSIYDALWNSSLTLNTAEPELTLCLQKSALLWIPCGWLLIAAIFYIPYLARDPSVNKGYKVSCLCAWKLIPHYRRCPYLLRVPGTIPPIQVEPPGRSTDLAIQNAVLVRDWLILLLCLSLVVLSVVDLSETLVLDAQPPPVDYAEASVKIVTTVMVTWLTWYAYRKGQHTSGVQVIFFVLFSITSAIQVYTYSVTKSKQPGLLSDQRFSTICVQFSIVVILLFSVIPSDMGAISGDAKKLDDSNKSCSGHADTEKAPLLGSVKQDSGRGKTLGGSGENNSNPRDFANWVSHAFLFWYWSLVVKGYKQTLTYSDMWDIRAEDESRHVHTRFKQQWDKELKRKNDKPPSLMKAMVRGFNTKILVATVLLVLSTACSLINPQLMSAVIAFVQSGSPYTWQGYLLAVCLFLMSVMGCVIMQQCYNLPCHNGLHLKTAVITAVYRKSLRISSSARKSATTGEVVNLMSVDAERISDSMTFIHFLFVTPFTVVITMIFIYQRLGPASLVGLAYLIVVIPLNSYVLGKFTSKYQKIQMKYKDLRLKLMNQILVGIKVLKLYAWEPYFQAKVTEIREKELCIIKKSAIVITLSYILSFSSNLVVALLCFITYTLLSPENILTPDKAFVSISLFSVLSTPIMFVPTALMFLMQAFVASDRIQRFLMQPEINPHNVQHDPHSSGAVNISQGAFSWGEAERVPLRDINVVIPRGKLVAVVGSVGSGKSSLLQAMLGEMDKLRGSVNINGSIAYVPQQAWIQNRTVRDNILFDKPYNEKKYKNVLDTCALTPDLKVLPGGDMTEIGERGINMSGGQKQRVSLARAIYQDRDVYLLDDPLSAVDSHVGKHIFNNAIGPNGVLAHTTRVLVTNAVTFLPQVDTILVLKDGEISENGSFDQLMTNNGAFADFLRQYITEQQESGIGLDETELELARQISAQSNEASESFSFSISSSTQSRRRKRSAENKPAPPPVQALVAEETVEQGTVQAAVIKAYIKACTFTWLAFMVAGLLVTVGGNVGSNIWLSEWSMDSLIQPSANVTIPSVYLRLGVYGGLGVVQMIGTFILVGSVAMGAIAAARTIHKVLLDNNLKSPMSFFDTTPTGRILNRYSKDVDIVDTNMRNYIQNLLMNISVILTTIVIITYSTPIFVVILVPLGIIFGIIQRIYVKTARQVKRIDSIKRSPIYANFSETLNGVSSIRAYRQEQRFIDHADNLLNDSVKISYSVTVSNRWIGIWLEMLGDLIVLSASIFAILQRDSLDPGTVGLSLSYALQVSWQIVLFIRYSCELETYIVAVERIKEYSEVTPEAPWVLEHRPKPGWPDAGAVDFGDYKTRYRPDLDLVLKGVVCDIKAGEKIGIVGRTGAGKSSMTLALFRIIEAAAGSIVIDGEDIAKMGLHDLRSKLTIIPQDPVLFSGSVRFNVDPADHYSDAEVWASLEQAHLKTFVAGLPDTLQYESGEDGENFSVGQRQLMCLARALLRRSKILIMDEATAAVDLETDDLIQATIRTEFKDSTVITIAHRLNTVLDYDRIVLMDDGVVREFDSPGNLLRDNKSAFYSMASDAGLV